MERQEAAKLICHIDESYGDFIRGVKGKINSMVEPSAPKFLVGTKVQVNPEVGKSIEKLIKGGPYWGIAMDKYIGKCGEVIIAHINFSGVKFADGNTWDFLNEHLLPAPPEPVFAPEDLDMLAYLEKVLDAFRKLVVRYTERKFRDNLCPHVVARRVAYLRRQIERIEEYMAAQKPEPVFKVGEWVKPKNSSAVYCISKIRDNGVIVEGLPLLLQIKDLQKVYVQLPGEKPAQGKWAKTLKDKGSHKAGEKVLLVSWNFHGQWKCCYEDFDHNYYSESELEMP